MALKLDKSMISGCVQWDYLRKIMKKEKKKGIESINK